MNSEKMLIAAILITAGCLIFRFLVEALRHRERMAAIDKGAALPVEPARAGAPHIYLLRGMMWFFSGIAIVAFLVSLPSPMNDGGLEFTLAQSEKLKEMGASQAQIDQYFADRLRRKEFPEGAQFIGLIPMFIGLAYLIFYGVEIVRLRRSG